MNRLWLRQYFSVVLFLLIGCAHTDISSFKEPTYDKVVIDNILILASIPDLGERIKLEKTVTSNLSDYGINSLPAIDIFLPTRSYEDKNIKTILKQNSIDNILMLKLRGKDSVTKSGSKRVYNVFEHRWDTVSSIYSQPVMYFDLYLLDIEHDKIIWVASTKTEGIKYANASDLINSLAETTVTKLAQDGLLVRQESNDIEKNVNSSEGNSTIEQTNLIISGVDKYCSENEASNKNCTKEQSYYLLQVNKLLQETSGNSKLSKLLNDCIDDAVLDDDNFIVNYSKAYKCFKDH